MKVIALLPIKNEAWVLAHTLACLSGFCDVILINDQQSQDDSRAIARRFSKAVWIESSDSKICEQARWQLWDVARDYEGSNLLWCTDADELIAPQRLREYIDREGARLAGGTVISANYVHLWGEQGRYRSGLGGYAPYWKPVAIVDDRRHDYDRSRALPLHEERVPMDPGAPRLQADTAPVLHLQWLLPNRSQLRQAWYRCREWMQGERSAAAINALYAGTLPQRFVPTAPTPAEWLQGLTLPGTDIDAEPSWQQADILRWFGERGVEFFEPLEIWGVPLLRDEFHRRTGRRPHADRSYREPWQRRARSFGLRAWNAARRRVLG
jgi:hypothetical protein